MYLLHLSFRVCGCQKKNSLKKSECGVKPVDDAISAGEAGLGGVARETGGI